MATYICSAESMHYIQNPAAFCEIVSMIHTKLKQNDIRVLGFHLVRGESIDTVVEGCRNADQTAASKTTRQQNSCPILEAVKEEYNATQSTALQVMNALRDQFWLADRMSHSLRVLAYLGQEYSIGKFRGLMNSLEMLGESIDRVPSPFMLRELERYETLLKQFKDTSDHLRSNEVCNELQKKKRRKNSSVAQKARQAKAYGRAWRQLNPTYQKECKQKWEAYNKLHHTEWKTVPLPKRNPITPAQVRAAQASIDARPQQHFSGPTATANHRIPLISV